MNFNETNITQKIAEIVEKKGFFLIEIIVRGTPLKRVIEVFIDGEKDISAEDCAAVSREINSEFENLPAAGNDYRLEVSSPGVDKPLKFLKQYPKHISRNFEISYKSEDYTKKLLGILKKIDNEDLTFLSKNNDEVIINFNNIKKAKVIVSFFPKG
jgi:ribosome maturation factor RimP